jgi:molybdate transport system substrate-binding protein
MNARTMVVLTGLLLMFAPGIPARSQTVRIAAAADLKFAMSELAKGFEKQSGVKMDVSYGSSGNFFSQLENGAPFDLFFSADAEYPKKLETEGLAETGTLYPYALGRICIWTAGESKLSPATNEWKTLLDERVKKIAIANPEHAPYGRAAVAALKRAGVYEATKSKLVFGENVSQAAQFVQSGNAQAGIVALSLATSGAMKNGERWDVPPNLHPPIEQTAIILRNAKNKSAARAFLDFVRGPVGRTILQESGFNIPAA